MPPRANAPAPTFAGLEQSLQRSPHLRGVGSVRVGRKHLADIGAANRVVLVPTRGNLNAKQQDTRNLHECPLTFIAHVWGADLDEAWALLGALDNAMWDFRMGQPATPTPTAPPATPLVQVEVTPGELSFDDENDSTDGELIQVAYTVRFVVERRPMPAREGSDAASTATVSTVKIKDSGGNVDPPTLPLP